MHYTMAYNFTLTVKKRKSPNLYGMYAFLLDGSFYQQLLQLITVICRQEVNQHVKFFNLRFLPVAA